MFTVSPKGIHISVVLRQYDVCFTLTKNVPGTFFWFPRGQDVPVFGRLPTGTFFLNPKFTEEFKWFHPALTKIYWYTRMKTYWREQHGNACR